MNLQSILLNFFPSVLFTKCLYSPTILKILFLAILATYYAALYLRDTSTKIDTDERHFTRVYTSCYDKIFRDRNTSFYGNFYRQPLNIQNGKFLYVWVNPFRMEMGLVPQSLVIRFLRMYSIHCQRLHRGSYMSAHVSLSLLNELGKRDKMRGMPSILSLFSQRA